MIDVSASANYIGDCRELLAQLPEGSVQTCVTSPPYFGLRDYGHEGQIGLETSLAAYIDALVDVFRGVRRALRDDGTLWLNLGDSYAGSGKGPSNNKPYRNLSQSAAAPKRWMAVPPGMKPKDLMLVPFEVAKALRSDGWWLRGENIWAKSDPMPTSCADRCASSHEFVWLLSKSESYFFDDHAIAEPAVSTRPSGNGFKRAANIVRVNADGSPRGNDNRWENTKGTRKKRDVWFGPKARNDSDHHGVYPSWLIEPCILAGSRPGDLVLDPFFGSGTTGQVAEKHGRRWIGFDLGYEELAKQRTAQRSLPMVTT